MDTTNSSEKPQRRVKHGQRPTEPLADWPAEFGAAGAEQPAATSGDAPADLQQLKALALAATPGPWTATHWNGHAPTTVMRTGTTMAIAETTGFGRDSSECAPDAAYIAAANPAVVLGLIARIERLNTSFELARANYQQVVEKNAELNARIESAAAPAPIPGLPFADLATAVKRFQAEQAAAPATASGDELPPLPDLPRAPVNHAHLGGLYDRVQMHQYAIRYADLARAAVSAATKPAAPAVPEEWREFVKQCSTFAGQMVNGNQLSRVAADLLAVTPAASTTGAAQTADQVRDQALEEAANACEAWGNEKVAKWADDAEMSEDAKARAWDAVQCAVAIRALKRPTTTQNSEAGE